MEPVKGLRCRQLFSGKWSQRTGGGELEKSETRKEWKPTEDELTVKDTSELFT